MGFCIYQGASIPSQGSQDTLTPDVQDMYDGGGLLNKSCPTLATPWTVAGQLQA